MEVMFPFFATWAFKMRLQTTSDPQNNDNRPSGFFANQTICSNNERIQPTKAQEGPCKSELKWQT